MIASETVYEWQNGNIVRKSFFTFEETGRRQVGEHLLTYDNKRNYANGILAFTYLQRAGETAQCRNNLIKTVDISTGQPYNRGSYDFSYNERGYPVHYRYQVSDFAAHPPIYLNYSQ